MESNYEHNENIGTTINDNGSDINSKFDWTEIAGVPPYITDVSCDYTFFKLNTKVIPKQQAIESNRRSMLIGLGLAVGISVAFWLFLYLII